MFQICNWKYWVRHTSKKTSQWWLVQWVSCHNRARYSMVQGMKTVHVVRSSMDTHTLVWRTASRMKRMMWVAKMVLAPQEVTLKMELVSKCSRKKWTISSSLAIIRITRMQVKNSLLLLIRWWAEAIITKAGSFIFNLTYWIVNTKLEILEKGMEHSLNCKDR